MGLIVLALDSASAYDGAVTVDINPAAVTTVAGNGSDATLDGSGTAASFRDMGGVVVESGFAYVATRGSIRKVSTSTGETTTLAGHATLEGCVNSATPTSVRFNITTAMTSDGTALYVLTDCGGATAIRKVVIATGATTTLQASAGGGQGITFGPDGFLYYTDGSFKHVIKVDPATGTQTTVATLAGSANAITADLTD